MTASIALVAALTSSTAWAPVQLVPSRPAAVERTTTASRWTIASTVLGEDRTVRVVLPESFARTTRPYPLVVVLDGESILFDVADAARALAAAGHTPEAVVVGVENTDRIRDLSPPGIPVSGNDGAGRGDVFVRFLKEELQPELSERFRASGPLWLVGHSSGALFAQWAVEPGWTAGALGLDAPMHLGDGAVAERLIALADRARATDAPALRVVSIEARFGWPDDLWVRLTGTAPDGWLLEREHLVEESHNSVVAPGSYRGLRALFAAYSTVAERTLPPLDRLRRFDARVSDGSVAGVDADPNALPPPRELLREVVADRIGALDLREARSTLARLEASYGADEASRTLRTRIDATDPDALEGPTLDELRATPIAGADDVGPILGEWRGVTRTEGRDTETPLGLGVRIDGGVVVAEITLGTAPPRPAEYLTVDGSTVHVGYMNGMNPRGMLLYEGVVDGDVFEGRFELRGVVFRMPDGRALPVTRFRLTRVGR